MSSPLSRIHHKIKFALKSSLLGLIFLTYACESDIQSVGQGVYHFQPSLNSNLEVYNLVEDSLPFVTFKVKFASDSIDLSIEKARGYDSLNINPLHRNFSTATFSFRVLSSREGWSKVVVDEDKKVFGWIKMSDSEIENWEAFLKSIHHITPMDGKLLKAPHSDDILNYSSYYHCYKVNSVYLDWIEVEHRPNECPDKNLLSSGSPGFIRWKSNGEFQINFRM